MPPPGPLEPPPTRWVFPELREGGQAAGFPDDLIASGADLEPGTLLTAYRRGLFPMPGPDFAGDMLWWSPVRRGVLPVHGLRVSRSLRSSVRRMRIRVDTEFEAVIDACADPSRDSGWIDDDIRAAYVRLHRMGWAHSVESWIGGRLVGGLYGVAIGGLFAGESMFHRVSDASKVALVGLRNMLDDEHAQRRLVDVQWLTPHLASLGAVSMRREEYLRRLDEAVALPLPAGFG
ncbi:MAG TPA: leucyl/phenylalanyl-tRNA--protein transferase [Nocardioidaceae bacterium]|nr:leucyl/phenylalanyl-tRNA--protein transferase [Nocardioidaceae bacterium]